MRCPPWAGEESAMDQSGHQRIIGTPAELPSHSTKQDSELSSAAKSRTAAQSGLSRIPAPDQGGHTQRKRDPKVPFSTCSPFPSGVLDQSPRRRLLVVRRHPIALGNRRSRVSIGGTPHTTFRAGFARAGGRSKRLTHFAFSSDTAGLPCRKDESVQIRCQDESVQICRYYPCYELDFRCSPSKISHGEKSISPTIGGQGRRV